MKLPIALAAVILAGLGLRARAADQPQWGQRFTRNMISDEMGLPDSFDVTTGKNIKWSVPLGSECYASPIVGNGKVFIGTNNEHPRDARHTGDRGILLCLDEKDGHLLWQLASPKMEDDRYLDWPKAGICSPPTVEGDIAYTLTNRGEIIALDINGLANGNATPYIDEGKHMALRGNAPMTPGPLDADIIWLYDLVSQAGIHTHDQVHGSILLDGDLLYVNSCNGVDNTHRKIRCPDAPTLVVLDKNTGQLLARDDQRIGPNIFHCQWSSPSMGIVNGQKMIFFGGDDGVVYAFAALSSKPPTGEVARLKTLWKFDTDPTAPKEVVHKWVSNHKESPSVIMGMPVFHNNRIYVSSGGDPWWGKGSGTIKCIDATKSGDITKTGEIWSYPLRNTTATPAIHDGLIYVADLGGTVHCLDAETGKPYWTHKAVGDFWSSCLVADGKVYIGSRRGQFLIFAEGKEKRLLATIDMGSPVGGTPTAANGTLFVATMTRLYAISSH
jgi:outer membrane protein assembly factor BamB